MKAIDLFEPVDTTGANWTRWIGDSYTYFEFASPHHPGDCVGVPTIYDETQDANDAAEELLLAAARDRTPPLPDGAPLRVVAKAQPLDVWAKPGVFVRPTADGKFGLAVLDNDYVRFAA